VCSSDLKNHVRASSLPGCACYLVHDPTGRCLEQRNRPSGDGSLAAYGAGGGAGGGPGASLRAAAALAPYGTEILRLCGRGRVWRHVLHLLGGGLCAHRTDFGDVRPVTSAVRFAESAATGRETVRAPSVDCVHSVSGRAGTDLSR